MSMPKVWKTNAAEALKHMQARYRMLSAMAESAIKTSRASGQPIPPAFLKSYGLAVKDYRTTGAELLEKLAEKGLSVEQVIYKDGKPEVVPGDPKRFRSVKITAPLRPPMFSGMGEGPKTDMGFVQLIIGGLIVIIAGRLVLVPALEKIGLMINGPNYEPDKQADATLKLFEAGIKRGLSAKESAEFSRGSTAPPPKSGSGIGVGTLFIGGLLLGGAAWVFAHKGQPALAA